MCCAFCTKDIYCTKSIYFDFFHEWNPTIYDKNNKNFNKCVIVIENDSQNINNNFTNLIVINCEKSMCNIISSNITVLENEMMYVHCPRMYFTYFNIFLIMFVSIPYPILCCLCYCNIIKNKKNVKNIAYCNAVPIF